MNDSQIIAIAITVLAVLAGTLFSNARIGDLSARIGDVNSNLAGRLTDLKEVFRAELQKETGALRAEQSIFRLEVHQETMDLRHLMERNHEAVLAELSRIDHRVTRLEERTTH